MKNESALSDPTNFVGVFVAFAMDSAMKVTLESDLGPGSSGVLDLIKVERVGLAKIRFTPEELAGGSQLGRVLSLTG